MRSLVALGILITTASATVAQAQPGQVEPSIDPEAPPVYVPPTYGYQPRPAMELRTVTLTEEERDLLEEGTIGTGRAIVGGVVGTIYGFGIGHTVQGRWLDKGWIFTVGETASMIALLMGVVQAFEGCDGYYAGDQYVDSCADDGDNHAGAYLVGGLVGFVGFRIWEIVDAWVGPKQHNARVRAVRMKVDPRYNPDGDGGYGLYIKPARDGGGGGIAGLSFKF